MAPEVLENKAYNLKADVYTFSLVVWAILTLEKPYGDNIKTMDSLKEIVRK